MKIRYFVDNRKNIVNHYVQFWSTRNGCSYTHFTSGSVHKLGDYRLSEKTHLDLREVKEEELALFI